jgi:8-oxo-dGTP pyrophosphatase MutT (NUDIX family)
MKNATHIGNATLVLKRFGEHQEPHILMGLKRPKDKEDDKRKRKRIGIGLWVPPGGGTESDDKTQKHAAQREVCQETGLLFPLRSFHKAGVLRGYLDSSNVPTWLVHLYTVDVRDFNQLIVPNEEYVEMRWFPLSRLPFRKMLQGDKKWLPRLAKGEKLLIKLVKDKNKNNAFSITTIPIKSFN